MEINVTAWADVSALLASHPDLISNPKLSKPSLINWLPNPNVVVYRLKPVSMKTIVEPRGIARGPGPGPQGPDNSCGGSRTRRPRPCCECRTANAHNNIILKQKDNITFIVF
jgi:hypothetical protein